MQQEFVTVDTSEPHSTIPLQVTKSSSLGRSVTSGVQRSLSLHFPLSPLSLCCSLGAFLGRTQTHGCATRMVSPEDCFGSVHPMSYGGNNIVCTEDLQFYASQQCSFLWSVLTAKFRESNQTSCFLPCIQRNMAYQILWTKFEKHVTNIAQNNRAGQVWSALPLLLLLLPMPDKDRAIRCTRGGMAHRHIFPTWASYGAQVVTVPAVTHAVLERGFFWKIWEKMQK